MIKEELSDEDLLILIDADSKSAELALYERYYRFSQQLGKYYEAEFKRTGIQAEEFTALAYEMLPKAVANRGRIKRARFFHYWRTLCTHVIYDYVRHHVETVGVSAEVSIYLDDHMYDGIESYQFHDVLGEEDTKLKPNDELCKILIKELKKKNSVFKENEKVVARLILLEEKEVEEVADEMGLSKSSVYYIFSTLKKKFSKIIKDSYL